MVSIRLSRGGAKNRPFYHVVVTDSRSSRDGRYIERVGFFNPLARGAEQRLVLDAERVQYWQSNGAQPTDRVARLIKDAFLQQNAMDAIDAYTTPAKQEAMLALLTSVYDRGLKVIEQGAPVGRLQDEVSLWPQVRRLGATVPNDDQDTITKLQADIMDQLASIEKDYVNERHPATQS